MTPLQISWETGRCGGEWDGNLDLFKRRQKETLELSETLLPGWENGPSQCVWFFTSACAIRNTDTQSNIQAAWSPA